MERVHATASLKKWLSVCYCSSELHVIFFHSYVWLHVKIIVTVPLCTKNWHTFCSMFAIILYVNIVPVQNQVKLNNIIFVFS